MGDPVRRTNIRGYAVRTRDGMSLGHVAQVVSCDDEVPAVHLDIVRDVPAMARRADDFPATSDDDYVRVLALVDEVDEDARVVVLNDAATLGLGTATAGLATSRVRAQDDH
jgi:hypothetical protein